MVDSALYSETTSCTILNKLLDSLLVTDASYQTWLVLHKTVFNLRSNLLTTIVFNLLKKNCVTSFKELGYH